MPERKACLGIVGGLLEAYRVALSGTTDGVS